MRKNIGGVCAFLGAFLLIVAVLFQTWAAGQLKKTPLDVDSTTRLEGTAVTYQAGSPSSFPVKATSVTKADAEKSDDDVVVFKNSSCLVKDVNDVPDCVSADDPEQRLLSAGFDDFATDRKTAMAVNDPKYLPADATEKEGLINKWPFDVEKKTYPYWVDTGVTDAVFDGVEEVDGLETYVFQVEVNDAPIQIAEGVDGLYSELTRLWIEPKTGQIVMQESEQKRALTDGTPVLDVELNFTGEQIDANVEGITADKDRLQLATGTVPLIGYVAGVPLLILGLVLISMSRRSTAPAGPAAPAAEREPALA